MVMRIGERFAQFGSRQNLRFGTVESQLELLEHR